MAGPTKVPDIVISRLPKYLTALSLLSAEGWGVVSSQDLASLLGVSSAQIRKDLSHFGEFGKQGTGYGTAYLLEQLSTILKIDREWEVALVGSGVVAEALIRGSPLDGRGFRISVVFDSRPARIGFRLGGLEILDARRLPDVVGRHDIKVAIIAVPPDEAQDAADALVAAGVRALLSYATVTLRVPPDVRVQYVDPAALLQPMAYHL